MIVSASRRCDIPRFSFPWFMERLDAGFVETANPFNPGQKRRIPLLPPSPERSQAECAEVFAFWTRDPAAILENATELEGRGYGFYAMTSLTAYPPLLEPAAPPAEAVVQTMRALARKITPQRAIWRYDPVFLSDKTDPEFHLRNFAGLAASLNGAVKRVVVSVYDEYAGAERRLAELAKRGLIEPFAHYASAAVAGASAAAAGRRRSPPGGTKPLLPAVRALLAELAGIAEKEGMEIQSCAEEDLSDCGVKSGACIDGGYIEKTFGIKTPGRDRNQGRPGCLCVKSADIGAYGNCPAGCVYCYGLRPAVT